MNVGRNGHVQDWAGQEQTNRYSTHQENQSHMCMYVSGVSTGYYTTCKVEFTVHLRWRINARGHRTQCNLLAIN